MWTSDYTSEYTCGHLNIHLSIHVVIWVCGRAWRLCAAPQPGSVPASEKSPDFSFQSLRCDGWYVGGLSDQKSYQTPLIFVILVSEFPIRWVVSLSASEAATSLWKFPNSSVWVLFKGLLWFLVEVDNEVMFS